MVLDEPTVFLPETEKVFLLELVRRVASEGTAVLFVSHDLTSVRGLCSRALILRDGRLVGDVDIADMSDDELVRLISSPDAALFAGVTGESPAERAAAAVSRRVALAVKGLSSPRLMDMSFALHEGEVLGVAGLFGSGSESLPYTLFGALVGTHGRVESARFSGDVASLSPRRAIQAGFALVPADPQRQSAVGSLSVEKNLLSLVVENYRHLGFLSYSRMRKVATERITTFRVRPAAPARDLVSLSGGNQQKAVLARWLERHPSVLLLHEPTQGVDVATRAEIYRIVEDLVSRGPAVLWVTTDFDELATVSERILVIDNGRVARELTGGRFTHDEISAAVYATSATTSASAR